MGLFTLQLPQEALLSWLSAVLLSLSLLVLQLPRGTDYVIIVTATAEGGGRLLLLPLQLPREALPSSLLASLLRREALPSNLVPKRGG